MKSSQIKVPRPTTPLRGGVVRLDFGTWEHQRLTARLNRRGNGKNARVKTHRDSLGVIWNRLPFYWTNKGFYRGGSHGARGPLHQMVWAHANRKPVPPGHVVVFLDGDKHNFKASNLALRSRAQIGTANAIKGQAKLNAHRQTVATRRWEKEGARRTDFLLTRFNRGQDSLAAKLKEKGTR